MKLAPRDALRISNVSVRDYDDGSRLRAFAASFPQTSKGKARAFDRDDVLAMIVQARLRDLGVTNVKAWEIAGELRRMLREGGEAVEKYFIGEGRDKRPRNVLTRPPDGRPFFTIPVRTLRAEITRRVAERLAN
jgi:hypothetical protein